MVITLTPELHIVHCVLLVSSALMEQITRTQVTVMLENTADQETWCATTANKVF